MAAHDLNGAVEPAHILYAKVDETTGAVIAQTGDVVSGEVYDEAATVFQQWGDVALPAPADVGVAAAEAHVWKGSGPDIVVAGRDVRNAVRAGNLKMGERCTFAPVGAARTLWKADGSINHFTTDDNTDNGKSIFSRVDLTGFTRFCPWGKETFGEIGYHLLHASGARLDLGSLSAPGLPPSLNSYASLSAQSIRIEGALISLGTQVGTPEPVAKATTLYALLTSIAGSLTSIVTQVTALSAAAQAAPTPSASVSANPAVTAALAAMTATITGTVSAIAGALLTLPSASTQTT